MRILFLHSSSDMYGASKILLITLQMLKKNGHKPLVVLSEDGLLSQALKKEHIGVRFIKLGIIRRKYFNFKGLINRFRTLWIAKNQLTELCIQENIDLIYSNTAAVIVGGWVARKCRLKHVFHIHEIIQSPSWFALLIHKMIARNADHVIAVSRAVKDHLSTFIPQHKISVIYNGLDYSSLSSNQNLSKELSLHPNHLIIGMIARVHPWKGQSYFIDLAEALLQKKSALTFIMVGDAYPGNEYLYDELNAKLETLGLKSHFINLGYREDIMAILNTLDLFILPSTAPDPFPTVILEAMSCQKTVIATAQGGALEMIEHQVSGIHIPLDNAQEAAKIISPYLSDEKIRRAMGQVAQQKVNADFSLVSFEKNIMQLLTVIHEH